ncbi:MAG: hypothetical protein R3B96_12900 [Pirellulaceae bacterium]
MDGDGDERLTVERSIASPAKDVWSRRACRSRSVLGAHVRVGRGAVVEDSILFEKVRVGEGARVRRAIIDKGNSHSAGSHDWLRHGSRPSLWFHDQLKRHRRDRQGRSVESSFDATSLR